MGFSAPRDDYIEIIVLQTIKKLIVIKPMSLSAPWADSLDIIILKLVKNILGI